MIDPKRPEIDPAETKPGARGDTDLPVRGITQGPRSPGASEPGDIAAPRNDAVERTTEPGETDSPADGETGHEAYDAARAETQRRK